MTISSVEERTASERPDAMPPVAASRTGVRRPVIVVAGICLLGVALTAAATWATSRVDRNAEERLLEVQTRQAASVLSTAVLLVQQPMATALSAQSAVGPPGDVSAFERLMSPSVGSDGGFVSASLWVRSGDGLDELASVGVDPGMAPDDVAMREFLEHALSTPSAVVRLLEVGPQTRIAWALADPSSGFVVYGERAVAPDRRARVDQDAAFADLHYAIYIGDQTDAAGLTTTDVDPSTLPFDEGLTDRVSVPMGDTVLTLTTTPSRHLGASLSKRLPLIVLAGGLLLTLMAGLVTTRLVRGRREAEDHTATITDLYQRVDSLYEEERALFVRLQRALLPQSNPTIPNIEIAADYVAGALGMDIGGDWYSVIGIDDEHFAFVVGDVSGRGLDAVAVMAHARFTLRAYLVDGHSPSTALEKCSRQFDISIDGHMTTVLAGVGNRRTGVIAMASAGHPMPLLLSDGKAEYASIPVGPPLGIGQADYSTGTFTMPVGSSLLLYTDGLIERRTESIDEGLARLVETTRPLANAPLETLVADVLTALRDDDATDDIAVLAIRRVSS